MAKFLEPIHLPDYDPMYNYEVDVDELFELFEGSNDTFNQGLKLCVRLRVGKINGGNFVLTSKAARHFYKHGISTNSVSSFLRK